MTTRAEGYSRAMASETRQSIIAVVDDDPRVLQALDLLLTSANYEVMQFDSATALLLNGCVRVIDCLISDIGMPGIDGLALLRKARAIRPRLPVIFISGRANAIDRVTGVAPDGCRFFTKPFDGEA